MTTITNIAQVIKSLAAWEPSNTAGTLLCLEAYYGQGYDTIQGYDDMEPCTREEVIATIKEDMEINGAEYVWRLDDGPGIIWSTEKATNIISTVYCNDEGDGESTHAWLYKHLCGEIDMNALHDADEAAGNL